jgi:hypothetical protein
MRFPTLAATTVLLVESKSLVDRCTAISHGGPIGFVNGCAKPRLGGLAPLALGVDFVIIAWMKFNVLSSAASHTGFKRTRKPRLT